LILFLAAFFKLRGLENIDHLVTTGLIAKLRHQCIRVLFYGILGWSIYTLRLLVLQQDYCIANILYWRT